ncbi:MAG: ABC transporter substrate binding protein [Motiliproteus sp.]
MGTPLSASSLAAATLAVLYPEVPAPYKQVFEQIITGIERQHDQRLLKLPLKKQFDHDSVLSNLQSQQVDMVITLGRRSFALTKELAALYPFVSGALPLAPNGISGVSLIADPNTLFTQLQTLAPLTERIFVLYTQKNRWLIALAKIAAREKNLQLVTFEVSGLAAAVDRYEDILAVADSRIDAIWLPLDSVTANEKVVLPVVLKKAWSNKLVVFSSKPSHARRGALFSMYPNNEASGVRLAQMVQEMQRSQSKAGVEPIRSLKVGVNLRTAAHLGLEYSQNQKKTFYAVFPSDR